MSGDVHVRFCESRGVRFPPATHPVVHCETEAQARHVLDAIAQRMAQVGLELHPDKTRIVYCKDADRRGCYEHERFNFLGYTFRRRLVKSKHGKFFASFTPAVSDDAAKAIRGEIRTWRLHRRSDTSLSGLAERINPVVQGWINYYGRFYKSRLHPSLQRINDYLVRWAMRKYKRLRARRTRAARWLASIYKRTPTLFAHWRFGLQP